MSTSLRLLDGVRRLMRLRHYSIYTERAYCDWIKRYVRHHGMKDREDLQEGEAKIEAFLIRVQATDGALGQGSQRSMYRPR